MNALHLYLRFLEFPIGCSVILAEYGDVRKFNNPGQMVTFAGLEPSINQSGGFNAKGTMVKRGSTHLRWH